MTGEQLGEALRRVFGEERPVRSAAEFFRVDRATVARWLTGEKIPFAVGALLRVMISRQIKPAKVNEIISRRLPLRQSQEIG